MRVTHFILSKYGISIIIFDVVLGSSLGWATFNHRLMPDLGFFQGFSPKLMVAGGGFFLPILCSTVVLTPFFIYFLARQLPAKKLTSYYIVSGISGFVFAILASGSTGFFMYLLIELTSSEKADWVAREPTLIYGPFLLGLAMLIAIPMHFFKELLVTGVSFGLINGWLVRNVAKSL